MADHCNDTIVGAPARDEHNIAAQQQQQQQQHSNHQSQRTVPMTATVSKPGDGGSFVDDRGATTATTTTSRLDNNDENQYTSSNNHNRENRTTNDNDDDNDKLLLEKKRLAYYNNASPTTTTTTTKTRDVPTVTATMTNSSHHNNDPTTATATMTGSHTKLTNTGSTISTTMTAAPTTVGEQGAGMLSSSWSSSLDGSATWSLADARAQAGLSPTKASSLKFLGGHNSWTSLSSPPGEEMGSSSSSLPRVLLGGRNSSCSSLPQPLPQQQQQQQHDYCWRNSGNASTSTACSLEPGSTVTSSSLRNLSPLPPPPPGLQRFRPPAATPGVVEETLVPGSRNRIATRTVITTVDRQAAKETLGWNETLRVVAASDSDDNNNNNNNNNMPPPPPLQLGVGVGVGVVVGTPITDHEPQQQQQPDDDDEEEEEESAPTINTRGGRGRRRSYKSSKRRFSYCTRRVRIGLIVVAVLIGAAATAALVVALAGARDNNNNNAEMDDDDDEALENITFPTVSPVQRNTSMMEQMVRAALENFLIPDQWIDQSPEAFERAIQWYANHDLPSRVSTNNDTASTTSTLTSSLAARIEAGTFLQRFLLAWTWFHSTQLGAAPWISCNPVFDNDDESNVFDYTNNNNDAADNPDLCQEQAFVGLSDSRTTPKFETQTSVRFMSRRPECEWVYVTCSNDDGNSNRVTGVSFVANGMTGSYPIFLTLIPTLQTINISFNAITGPLPSALATATNLTELWHEKTTLRGSIPDDLYNLTNLERLVLAQNSELSGTISTKIGQLEKLVDLRLFQNFNVRGSIPPQVGRLTNLRRLFWAWMSLSFSSIPEEIGQLDQLQELQLHGNALSGTLPESFTNLNNLHTLRLSENRLRGTLPDLHMPLAKSVRLDDNLFRGDIPDSLYINDGHMYTFALQNNLFGGTISELVGNFYNVKHVDLFKNQFTGPIPASLGDLSNLVYLDLGRNNFDGSMPNKVCALRDGLLEGLRADCGVTGSGIKNPCSCCTACCAGQTCGIA